MLLISRNYCCAAALSTFCVVSRATAFRLGLLNLPGDDENTVLTTNLGGFWDAARVAERLHRSSAPEWFAKCPANELAAGGRIDESGRHALAAPRNCCQTTRLTAYRVVQATYYGVSSLLKMHVGGETTLLPSGFGPFWDARRVAGVAQSRRSRIAQPASRRLPAGTVRGTGRLLRRPSRRIKGAGIAELSGNRFAVSAETDQMSAPASYFGLRQRLQSRSAFEISHPKWKVIPGAFVRSGPRSRRPGYPGPGTPSPW